jgi:hypothetical protein
MTTSLILRESIACGPQDMSRIVVKGQMSNLGEEMSSVNMTKVHLLDWRAIVTYGWENSLRSKVEMQTTKKNSRPQLKLVAPEEIRLDDLPPTEEFPLGDSKLPAAQHATSSVEYEFLKCLEHNALGEVWLVRTSLAKDRLAQFLPPGSNEAALQRLEFIHCNKGLLSFQVARRTSGQPILVTDRPKKTLGERFQECWSKGQPGIPRSELLSYIRTAAETLDNLYVHYRVQHLGLNPKYLVLHGGRFHELLIAGFGLAELLLAPTQHPISQFNPRYSAPELYNNRPSSRSDQYSLALIYAELLTGVHPLRGCRDFRPGEGRLDLRLLSSSEQQIVGRALAANPPDRFGTILDLVAALEGATSRQSELAKKIEAPSPIITCSEARVAAAPSGLFGGVQYASLDHFVSELVVLAAGPVQVREFNKIRYTVEPGQWLGHRCAVGTYPGAALLKLEGFRQQWGASLVRRQQDLLVFSVDTAPSFWQRLTGRQVGLEIQVQMLSPERSRRSEVHVVVRPYGCGRRQAIQLLEQTGVQLLESVRSYLLAHPEQRSKERLTCSQPLRVRPVIGGVELADPIDCVSKDISLDGIGIFLPKVLTTPQIYIDVPNLPDLAGYAGLAQIVRKKSCGDGWYEIGAAFARPQMRK